MVTDERPDTSGFNVAFAMMVASGDRQSDRGSDIDPVHPVLTPGTTYKIAVVYNGMDTRTSRRRPRWDEHRGHWQPRCHRHGVAIGYNPLNPSVGFRPFFVDDVRFWRVALTPAQVAVAATTPALVRSLSQIVRSAAAASAPWPGAPSSRSKPGR